MRWLILISGFYLVWSQNDFGTGDYTDTGEEGVDIDTPNFVPDALTTTRRPTTTTPRMVVVFQRPRPRTTLRPSTRGRTTPPEDKPWLENRVVEDTVLNRLLDFVENFAQDLDRVQDGEYTAFARYQLTQLIDVFRYRGYDQHHHFYHCTQRPEGCLYVSKRRLTTTTTTRRPRTTTTTSTTTASSLDLDSTIQLLNSTLQLFNLTSNQ